MWRRPAVSIVMLISAVILTLPMPAQQKIVIPGVSPAQADVEAGFSPAPDGSRSRQPSHLRFSNTCGAALKGAAITPGASPAKPFTQEQVVSMVRDGFGDESGGKLIEQRGIDFAPSEDFYQTLKAAGASEAFLNALRAAVAPRLSPAGNVAPGFSPAPADLAASLPRHGGVKPPLRHAALKGASTTAGPSASAKNPLNQVQVFALLAGQVPGHRVTMLVQERGIDFEPTDDGEVRLAGGEGEQMAGFSKRKCFLASSPVREDKPGRRLGCDGPPRSFVGRRFPSAHTGRWGNARLQRSNSVFGSPAAGWPGRD